MTVTEPATNDPTRRTTPHRIVHIPANDLEPVRELTANLNTLDGVYAPLAGQGTDTVDFVRTERLQQLLPGSITQRWPGIVMIVDDEGLLRPLPGNRRATGLYFPDHGHIIAGDAYLAGEGYGDAGDIDLISLPAEVSLDAVLRAVGDA